MLSKKLLSMFNRSSRYREVELKASITSDYLSSERDNMKSLSKQNKRRSPTRGAQLVPIEIHTIRAKSNINVSKNKVRASHTC